MSRRKKRKIIGEIKFKRFSKDAYSSLFEKNPFLKFFVKRRQEEDEIYCCGDSKYVCVAYNGSSSIFCGVEVNVFNETIESIQNGRTMVADEFTADSLAQIQKDLQIFKNDFKILFFVRSSQSPADENLCNSQCFDWYTCADKSSGALYYYAVTDQKFVNFDVIVDFFDDMIM